MTSHPKDVSEALIEVIGARNQVCEHVHLPVQSGSDRILAAMNRRYDRGSYLDLVARLRRAVPDLALTTDLIVGFPGETEEDFQQTLALVEQCRFDGAFTFIYSPRRDTAAAALPGRLPAAVTEERMARLVEVVQRVGRERNQAMVGRTVEVMVERRQPACRRRGDGEDAGTQAGELRLDGGAGEHGERGAPEATSTSFRGRQVRVSGGAGGGAGGAAAAEPPESGALEVASSSVCWAPPGWGRRRWRRRSRACSGSG